jgi:hypothetical protein
MTSSAPQWWILSIALLLDALSLTVSAESKGLANTNHWAFKPPVEFPLPACKNAAWVRNSIDAFILARLEKDGLQPAPEADRRTLIRRLKFDLLGLPPTPEEVRDFQNDSDPQAYERLVERYLASPQFGERWARHWLDVVRFAESNGFETNTPRPNSYPYRDYVINAFNSDKPYDRFVFEQLAGDTVAEDAATGFIVGGSWDEVKSPDINLTLQQRMDELHDMVATTGSAFLGITVGCARCHDHKFDPILQTDYYAIQAVFAGVQHGERALRVRDYEERTKEAERLRPRLAQLEDELSKFLRGPVNPKINVEKFEAVRASAVRFTISQTTDAEPCIDELEVWNTDGVNIALASNGAKPSASGTYAGSEFHKLEHINDGKVGNGRSWISNQPGKGWAQIDFAEPALVERIVWGRDREEKYADRLATHYKIELLVPSTSPQIPDWKTIASSDDRRDFDRKNSSRSFNFSAHLSASEQEHFAKLQKERSEISEKLRALTTFPKVYAGRFEEPGPTYRLNRGEPQQKREQVNPGALARIGCKLELSAETPEQARRVALAKWIASAENPLTARVIVNRLWQYHFGEGLVSTPSDFGANGARPINPELLDWLALQLVRSGWSLKAIHRLIVTSAAYRQSSAMNSRAAEKDAANRLLWRFSPQRLEAEPLRDAILFVSGNLDPRMGGRGFDLFEPNDNYVRVFNSKTKFGPGESRRMIYLTKHRMRLDDTFGAFDCPDAGQIAPKRNSSTTPLQALNLLNSPFAMQQAEILAKRIQEEAGSENTAQVRRAFELVLQRQPNDREIQAALELTKNSGVLELCRSLLNANEFIYVF